VRVLVVEDDPVCAALMMMACRQESIEHVHRTKEPVQAKAYCRGWRFGVVILDVQLDGGGNGIELARWVRVEYPHTRIIVCSGKDHRRAARLIGAQFVGKDGIEFRDNLRAAIRVAIKTIGGGNGHG
jgi:DNA-binding NarL/FixJ family response regulator